MAKLIEILASRLKSWLTFGDYGSKASRSMILAWASIGCFIIVDLIWLQASSFLFASSNWDRIFKSSLIPLAMFLALLTISHRLRDKTDRVGVFLREVTRRADLLWRGLFVMAALSVSAIIFSFLASGAALPLKDAWLAEVDRHLGFDWVGLLDFANANPTLSWILVKSYHSTGAMLLGVYVWLSLTGRAERLAEFIAILCTSSVAVGAGMILVPAAGAYTHYNPPQELFSNFSVDAGMWHYKLLMALRTDTSPVIDLAKTEGMVTFPSFHTVLGIITAYALRDTRWIAAPAVLLNGTMIVATLPEGGHYLLDVIAGGVIAVIAIATVRLVCRLQIPASALEHNLPAHTEEGLQGGAL